MLVRGLGPVAEVAAHQSCPESTPLAIVATAVPECNRCADPQRAWLDVLDAGREDRSTIRAGIGRRRPGNRRAVRSPRGNRPGRTVRPLMPDDDAVARVSAALGRLDDVGGRTNCVADRDDSAVLATAATARSAPLQGEPITVKDWIDVSGFRCSGGVVAHTDRRPEHDAPAIARLRRAGAVVIAKTAVLVDSERYGPVMNPHDVSRSPGGSSSGEAAAVGGGAVRLGLGSDSGGSIRVPAAWCRVVGMKPSAGLIPVTGHFPRIGDRSDGRTVLGPLADSVALAWSAVKVMAGPAALTAASRQWRSVIPTTLRSQRCVSQSDLLEEQRSVRSWRQPSTESPRS